MGRRLRVGWRGRGGKGQVPVLDSGRDQLVDTSRPGCGHGGRQRQVGGWAGGRQRQVCSGSHDWAAPCYNRRGGATRAGFGGAAETGGRAGESAATAFAAPDGAWGLRGMGTGSVAPQPTRAATDSHAAAVWLRGRCCGLGGVGVGEQRHATHPMTPACPPSGRGALQHPPGGVKRADEGGEGWGGAVAARNEGAWWRWRRAMRGRGGGGTAGASWWERALPPPPSAPPPQPHEWMWGGGVGGGSGTGRPPNWQTLYVDRGGRACALARLRPPPRSRSPRHPSSSSTLPIPASIMDDPPPPRQR